MTSWARRATRRRIRKWAGAMAPSARTMPLLLLLLLLLLPLLLPLLLLPLLLPLLALLERCPWHSTAHHGVTQWGTVTSQPSLPTAATPLAHCPSPKHCPRPAPPPHGTLGGRGSQRGGTPRLSHPAPQQRHVQWRPLTSWPCRGIVAGSPQHWGGPPGWEQPSPTLAPCFLAQAGAAPRLGGTGVGNGDPARLGFSWELPWHGRAAAACCPQRRTCGV